MFFPPWWLLVVCLVVSAFAAYLLLERTQAGDSPWALYPLTALLTPVVLAAMVFVGIALSTFVSAVLKGQSGAPPEGTGAESTLVERAIPFTTSTAPSAPPTAATPSASPTASPTASPASSSPSASPTASPTASPKASSSASPSP